MTKEPPLYDLFLAEAMSVLSRYKVVDDLSEIAKKEVMGSVRCGVIDVRILILSLRDYDPTP